MHIAEQAPRERFINYYLKERTPDFIAPGGVRSITPSFIRDHGYKALFLDVEGTFVQQDALEPDGPTIEHLDRLRDAGLNHIVLVTNKRVKNPATFITLSYWGMQARADMVMTPLDPSWRKPRPVMINTAAERLNIQPQEILMAGDKLTADVLAANRAGVSSLWVPEPFGGRDLVGDKVFRRPYEKLISRPMQSETLLYDTAYMPSQTERKKPRDGNYNHISWWSSEIPEDLLHIPNVLYGFGIEHVGELRNNIFGSTALYEHGGEIADALSDVRPLMKAVGAVLEKNHPKLAAAVKAGASATDILDGFIAKRSKRGPTADGAKKDERRDKLGRTISEVGMVRAGALNASHLYERTAADLLMTGLRRNHTQSGGDGSAVMPGKLATAIVDIADITSPLIRNDHPLLAEIIDEVATTAKLARIPGNLYYFRRREQERELLQPHLAALTEQLAEAA